jgi:HJR/Mrr/RecB family endonuclease
MSTPKRIKEERIKRMKEEARLKQRMRELSQVKPKSREFGEYKFPTPVGYETTNKYKSVDTGASVAAKKESPKYTGTLVKGIGTMHKSNAVPIINEEQARDIATMRRN